jgi:hypothetical protein
MPPAFRFTKLSARIPDQPDIEIKEEEYLKLLYKAY